MAQSDSDIDAIDFTNEPEVSLEEEEEEEDDIEEFRSLDAINPIKNGLGAPTGWGGGGWGSKFGLIVEGELLSMMEETSEKIVRAGEMAGLDFTQVVGDPSLWQDVSRSSIRRREQLAERKPHNIQADVKVPRQSVNIRKFAAHAISSLEIQGGQMRLTETQRKHAQYVVAGVRTASNRLAIVPGKSKGSKFGVILGLSYRSPLHLFTDMWPSYYPYASSEGWISSTLDGIDQARNGVGGFINPATAVLIRDMQPTSTTDVTNITRGPPNPDRSQDIAWSSFQSRDDDWRVESIAIQPLLGDFLIKGPDNIRAVVEGKAAQMRSRAVQGSVPNVEIVYGSGKLRNTGKRIGLFDPSRRWDYVFFFHAMGYESAAIGLWPGGFFVPQQHFAMLGLQVEPLGKDLERIVVSLETLRDFEVDANDVSGSMIRIISSHPPVDRVKMPQFVADSNVPPTSNSGPEKLSRPLIGPTIPKRRMVPWLFERINDYLCSNLRGVLIQLVPGHDYANCVLLDWVWSERDVERWHYIRKLPVDLGSDLIHPSTSLLKVRIMDASHHTRRDDRLQWGDAGKEYERAQWVSTVTDEPSLCILDLHGTFGLDQPSEFVILPSELVSRFRVYSHDYIWDLVSSCTWHQFRVLEENAGLNLGHHLISFLDLANPYLSWARKKTRDSAGAIQPLRLPIACEDADTSAIARHKLRYFRTKQEILQRQVDLGSAAMEGDEEDNAPPPDVSRD